MSTYITEAQLSALTNELSTITRSIRTLLNNNATDLSGLNTTAKSSLVAAINELHALSGVQINDGAAGTTTVWSSSKTTTEIAAALSALIGSAPATLDTITEIANAFQNNPNAISALNTAVANKISFETQTLTAPQQAQARSNIGVVDSTTDFVAQFNAGLV